MAAAQYLAMTAAEIRNCPQLPSSIAWMACHFSPYGLGLSNLPGALPSGSMLMLDDITPIHGHDPQIIARQLQQAAEALDCRGILLDFQRPGFPEAAALASFLAQQLPCSLAVSEVYARDLDTAVFLSPPPPDTALEAHLAPWQGREVWLEMALTAETVTLTPKGAHTLPLPPSSIPGEGFSEEALHCHYRAETREDAVCFTLWRTMEDLEHLRTEAEALGVTCTLGLYQELGK